MDRACRDFLRRGGIQQFLRRHDIGLLLSHAAVEFLGNAAPSAAGAAGHRDSCVGLWIAVSYTHLIATGPGVSAWFVPTEVDGRLGGTVTHHFGGGMDSAATITEWDAPHRFVKEDSWGPNAPTVATEWTVEARGGGTCMVRVVHSLFAETDDWDDQLTGVESGWPSFFRILRLYLEHFAGQPSSQIQLLAMPAASGAWEKLAGALNLAGAAEGERRDAGDGAPPLSLSLIHI